MPVYAATNPMFPGWVKIGQSANPEKRVRDFNTYAPESYRLERTWHSASEKIAHMMLDPASLMRRKEWFRIESSLAFKIVDALDAGRDYDHIRTMYPRYSCCRCGGDFICEHSYQLVCEECDSVIHPDDDEVTGDGDTVGWSQVRVPARVHSAARPVANGRVFWMLEANGRRTERRYDEADPLRDGDLCRMEQTWNLLHESSEAC
jgi:hypothetical protein